MLNKSKLCKKYINALGREVTIIKSNGSEDKLLAVVQSIWRGGRERYEKHNTEIGLNLDDYYSFICSNDYDITNLTENDIVYFENKKYHFVHTEPIVVGGVIQYYTGTIKREWEAKDVFI